MSDEIIKQLTKWQVHCLAFEEQWYVFRDSTGAGMDSPLGRAVWSMVDAYTAVVAEIVDAQPSGVPDFTNDLTWYAYENDFGRDGKEAGITGDIRPICTPTDLAWLITQTNASSS